jgi:hypothetical protein
MVKHLQLGVLLDYRYKCGAFSQMENNLRFNGALSMNKAAVIAMNATDVARSDLVRQYVLDILGALGSAKAWMTHAMDGDYAKLSEDIGRIIHGKASTWTKNPEGEDKPLDTTEAVVTLVGAGKVYIHLVIPLT